MKVGRCSVKNELQQFLNFQHCAPFFSKLVTDPFERVPRRLAVRTNMPVSCNFCITAVATTFLICFFFRQAAFGTAGPSFLLHSAASGARYFQLVLAERTFDEVVSHWVSTLRTKRVFAGG